MVTTLADAKKLIGDQEKQKEALEARISPLEQVIAARDQELRDLKVQLINQNQLKTAIDREKLINADLRAKVAKLSDALSVVGAIAKTLTVEAKVIRKLAKEHA